MKNVEKVFLKPTIRIQRNYPVNLIEDDISDFSAEFSYNTNNCFLKLIKNAWVTSDSIVFQRGLLVEESLPANADTYYYQFRYFLKKNLKSKKNNLSDGKKYLLATDLESAGHFHWFAEGLPKLFCLKDIAHEFVLLLPDTPYIRKIAIDSLKLLKLDFEDLVLMNESEFYKVKNLYYITKPAQIGLNDEIMKEIRREFVFGKDSGNKKLYISREKAGFRKVLNEKELIVILKNYGFENVYAEDLSLSEQNDLFSSCGILLGIHGAGLTNCIFMEQGSKVVELRRKETAKNTGYWHLADSLNHNYYYYNGIPDSEKSIIGRGCNLTIPIDDFEEKILRNL